jgi:hypothetical protein
MMVLHLAWQSMNARFEFNSMSEETNYEFTQTIEPIVA